MKSKSCTKRVKVHGNFHVPKYMERYMEISMYLAVKHMARYMEISMYFYNGIARKYMDISIYQGTLAAKRHMKISAHLHCCIKVHGRHIMNT